MTATMTPPPPLRYEDVAGVSTRICWGAILAGAVVATASYLTLTLFAAAIGLSLTGAGVRDGTAAAVSVVAALISIAASLYVGGWVSTRLTVGENRAEAILHGLLTYATVTALSLAMVGVGVRTGYNALLGTAILSDIADVTVSWESAAKAAGVSDAQIAEWRGKATPETVRAEVQDPETRRAAQEIAAWTTWTALAGMVLAAGTSVAGALAGAGPEFRLRRVITTATHGSVNRLEYANSR